MARRLKHEFRKLIKARFGVSDETLADAEAKDTLLLYPDDRGQFTGGYGIEFCVPGTTKPMVIVFPIDCFEDDAQDEVDQEVAS